MLSRLGGRAARACGRAGSLGFASRKAPPAARARWVSLNAQQFKERTKDDLGLWDAADTMLDKQEKRELRLQRPTYDPNVHALIKQMVDCINSRDFDAGWAVFTSHTAAPHEALTSTALKLCSKARWTERAWDVWGGMPVEHKSVIGYSIMIDLCARCKRSMQAEELWEAMQNAGIKPNLITFNSLLKAYAMTGQPDRALEIFESIPKDELDRAGQKTRQACYQTVMSTFARCGDYAGTYKLFMQMVEAGIQPVIMHYTALLTACARNCDGKTADGVFASMVSAGIRPDVPSYTILISCNRQNLERCKQILQEMIGAGVQPSVLTQQELLEAHIVARDGAGARALLADMDASRLREHVKFAQLEDAVSRLP